MDVEAPSSSAPSAPDQLKKSNSTGSTGAHSTKSHASISVLGAHPYGSLHIHQPTDILPHNEDDLDEQEDSPPPLDSPLSPASQKRVMFSAIPPEVFGSQSSLSTTAHETRETLTHSMGGGDVLLILDLPEVSLVGYDAVSFTAKHFGGIRDIPTGPHFFWVTHPDSGSVRTGFWITSSGIDQVHVLQWDKFTETILEPSRAEARIQADNLESFHEKLVPYHDPSSVNQEPIKMESSLDQDSKEKLRMWKRLSESVTERVLNRVTGQRANSWHVDTTDRVKGAVLLAAEMELERRLSNHLLQSRELNFSFSQNSKTYNAESLGADRTLAATDATPYMKSVMTAPGKELTDDDVVGELQFAFIVGVHLGNDACIQQWWHMVLKLVLKAHLLPEYFPVLASKLLQAIASQIRYSSEWLGESILDYGGSNSHDLRLALIVYKRRLAEVLERLGQEATADQIKVGSSFAKVEAEVVGLGWDLYGDYLRKGKVMMEDGEEVELEMAELQAEDERGEWAPEVVQLDEQGRQLDLVSWND
ncbi:AAR2 domain-containing protein [Trichoderma austrokoningii]